MTLTNLKSSQLVKVYKELFAVRRDISKTRDPVHGEIECSQIDKTESFRIDVQYVEVRKK